MAVRPMKVWNAATSTWDDVAVSQRGDVALSSDVIANSLVSGKGSLIAATADDTPADLPVGSNGQMLMADSSATAGLRYVDPPANRNLVINGAMQVAQYGSATTSGGGYFSADRWRYNRLADAPSVTVTTESDGPTGSGFRKSFKVLWNDAVSSPAAGNTTTISQRIEGQNLQSVRKGTSSAQQLTCSFWVKASVTGTYVVRLQDSDNTRHVSQTYSVSSAGTWEYKTVTFPSDTTGTLNNDNAESMSLIFGLIAGTDFTSGTLDTTWASVTNANAYVGQVNAAAAANNYWQITGVQLETGIATPFEFEPYEATLRKCQRYYQRSLGTGMSNLGAAISTSEARAIFQFERTMRAAPTITLQPVGGGAGQAIFLSATATTPGTLGTHAAAEITANRFRLTGTGYTGAFVAGQGVFFWTNTTDGVVYEASAEL